MFQPVDIDQGMAAVDDDLHLFHGCPFDMKLPCVDAGGDAPQDEVVLARQEVPDHFAAGGDIDVNVDGRGFCLQGTNGRNDVPDGAARDRADPDFAGQTPLDGFDFSCRFAHFLKHVQSPARERAADSRGLHALRRADENRRADIALNFPQHAGSRRLCQRKCLSGQA